MLIIGLCAEDPTRTRRLSPLVFGELGVTVEMTGPGWRQQIGGLLTRQDLRT